MSQICNLDEDNCLTLDLILKAFHCGIKEEQSWALIYQSIVSLKEYISKSDDKLSINELLSSHLFIQNNGTINQKSWHYCSQINKRVSIKRIVSSIGVVVYEALDYGNSSDEESIIMSSLEHVFDIMTHEESTDEGIEEEDDGSEAQILDKILENCRNHIYDNSNVGEHYRNVCRALVAEAIEMSTFLNQISIGTKELQKNREIAGNEVENLHVQLWAHLWMKVMRQLRVGVSLKSIDKQEFSERQKREYELTPFEMLLDDINSKRYNLKKVISLPHKVETDARNMILQFIRSRPPLKPAAERLLKPLPETELCLHEKLMEGIKQTHSLKPTPPLRRKYDSFYIPRGKRHSSIYPLTRVTNHTISSTPETPNSIVSTFRRLSFRNLSLRNGVFDRNRVINPLPAPQIRRPSFWAKFCHSIW